MNDEGWKKLNDDMQRAKRKRSEDRLTYPIFSIDREPWILPPLTEEEVEAAITYMSKTEEGD